MYRLTYFVCSPTELDQWKASHRFEVWGSAEAIFDLWFHLHTQQYNKENQSARPRFITVYNKDGQVQDMKKGLFAMSSVNTFK